MILQKERKMVADAGRELLASGLTVATGGNISLCDRKRGLVAITSSGARYFLRQLSEPTLPNLIFLAHNEVPPGLRVQSLGNIQ